VKIYDEYERGRLFFDYGDYITAAEILAAVVSEVPDDVAPRLLLARAYYHSAQLGRAETELRIVLERDPTEHYAHLVLGRTLQRQSRHAEAARHMRLAAAMTGSSH
jgi:Tfp pilus assembly protein PilF